MPVSISNVENCFGSKVDPASRFSIAAYGLPILLSIFLVAIIFCAYAQTRDFDFINYDDAIYTTDNAMVQKGLTLDGVIWAFTEGTYHTNYWAPLTWITFFLDYELYGMDPGGYHLTNVLFHVLNSLLLFIASLYLTGSMGKSFLLALFFGIHPLHVESVAWVSERKDVVSTMFWMLTLITYTQYVRKPGYASYSLVVIMFICCLMGKPMGVTLPFVLLILDYWPLGRYGQGKSKQMNVLWLAARRLVLEKFPLFLIIAILIPVTYYAQSKAGALKPLVDIPLFFRIENVMVSYGSQVLKTFWPINLGILYPYPESLPLWQPVTAFLVLAAITGIAMKFFFKSPYLIAGWAWFLGTFVPVAGFVVIGPHVTADRYTYIPLIGFSIMVIWGGSDLCAHLKIGKKSAICLATSILAALTWLTWKQVGYWENNIKIYTHTLEVTAANWPVHLNLGAAYREKKMDGQALEQYRSALRLRPDILEVQISVGEVLSTMGRTEETISHYENALRIHRESVQLHTALAVALDKSGETDRAVAHFLKAIESDNNSAEAHHGLGVTFFQQGQVDLAIDHYRKAVRIDRDFALAYNNLGIALVAKGELNRARARFSEAISFDPDFVDPLYALGVLYLQSGDKYSAASHFNRALEIDHAHAGALMGLRIALEK